MAGLNNLSKEDKRAAENHFDQELKRKREQENETSHEEVRATFFRTLPFRYFLFLVLQQLICILQAAKKRKHNEIDKQKSTKLWEIKERLKVYNSNELKAILMYAFCLSFLLIFCSLYLFFLSPFLFPPFSSVVQV